MGKVDNNKHIVNSSDGKSGRSGLNVMLRLIGLVKPLAGYMAVAILMGLAGHLCASFITIFGGYAILDVSGYDTGLTLGVIFVCVIVFALVRAGFRYAEQSCNHFIAFKLLAIIRDKVFRALRKLCPARLEGRDRGDLISIITSDIELLEVFYALHFSIELLFASYQYDEHKIRHDCIYNQLPVVYHYILYYKANICIVHE